MGRGRDFSLAETEIIKDNFDKTIAELEVLLSEQGYSRSRKSINRKLEKLRENKEVGFRSRDTVKRSYRQRRRRNKRLEPSQLDDNTTLDNGQGWGDVSSFDTGIGWEGSDDGFEE